MQDAKLTIDIYSRLYCYARHLRPRMSNSFRKNIDIHVALYYENEQDNQSSLLDYQDALVFFDGYD